MPVVLGEGATRTYTVPGLYYRESDPTADDDQLKGFQIGDQWVNTTTERLHLCRRNAHGVAEWISGADALVGPQGEPGEPGPQGDQGIPGPSAVSTDSGNLAILGNDGFILVPNTSVLKGVTDGSEADPGAIGEYLVTSNVVGVNMSSDIPTQICALSLTPGDWEIWGAVNFVPPGNVSPNMIAASISVHPDALPSEADLMTGVGVLNMFTTTALTSGQRQMLTTGQCRSNSASPLDLYLVAQIAFTAGGATVPAKGYICARRVR
jgi:hypothetical protein